MNRRDFIRIGGTGAAAAIAGKSGLSGATPSRRRRPNILFIFSDQQHWQAMGCVNDFFDTPNLDNLARESAFFTQSFCPTPQCSASRSSLLTGLYPHKTRVMGNVGSAGGNPLDQPTLAPALQEAGYRTAYFGKWHLGDETIATGGWDEKSLIKDDPAAVANAVRFLREQRGSAQPFALFVSINNPHDIYGYRGFPPTPGEVPLPVSWERETFSGKPTIQQQFMREDQGKVIVDAPREEWEQYRACYREKTRLYDADAGAVLNELKAQGLWEDTVVFATSDHGDMDTEHRLIFKGPFMYEHMVRVPLMIRLPERFGGAGPGKVDKADVVNVDLFPTIRELCGLPASECDGKSLLPLLTGSGMFQPRDFVIGQYYGKQKWVNPIRMIRTRRFKLNRHIRWGDELYDLNDDPHELINLAGDPDYAVIQRDLGDKLEQWMQDNGDPFRTFQPTTIAGETLA